MASTLIPGFGNTPESKEGILGALPKFENLDEALSTMRVRVSVSDGTLHVLERCVSVQRQMEVENQGQINSQYDSIVNGAYNEASAPTVPVSDEVAAYSAQVEAQDMSVAEIARRRVAQAHNVADTHEYKLAA